MPGVNSVDAVALLRRSGFLPTLVVVFLLGACDVDQVQISPLFASADTPLSVTDQNAIHAIFAGWFALSADGLRFRDEGCGDIPVRTEIIDLNGDGRHEVFVYWGNSCTSGATGNSLSMFAKDDSGAWHDQFGLPTFDYTTLASSNDGYPDLELGGPGFCFAVWSWNGGHYEFKCNAPQEDGGCQHTGNVCQTN